MSVILVIEDDPMNRDMLARRLRWEGYQTLTAADGVEGAAVAQAERPSLVLLDMGLPVVSGWKVAEQLKAAPDTRAIPIIALTAFALAEDRTRALGAGCDDYETKPVEFARLLQKIDRLIAASDQPTPSNEA